MSASDCWDPAASADRERSAPTPWAASPVHAHRGTRATEGSAATTSTSAHRHSAPTESVASPPCAPTLRGVTTAGAPLARRETPRFDAFKSSSVTRMIRAPATPSAEITSATVRRPTSETIAGIHVRTYSVVPRPSASLITLDSPSVSAPTGLRARATVYLAVLTLTSAQPTSPVDMEPSAETCLAGLSVCVLMALKGTPTGDALPKNNKSSTAARLQGRAHHTRSASQWTDAVSASASGDLHTTPRLLDAETSTSAPSTRAARRAA